MKEFDIIVIGFGKAGKTLAARMSSLGKSVALVEQDKGMYGGTCINIGCIPTKTLINAAEENLSFDEAMRLKDTVISRLNDKNMKALVGAGVTLYNARARFIDDKVIELNAGDEVEQLTAEIIIINTGAVSNILPLPGLADTKNVYDSTGIQRLKEQPQRLGIIGGGNIGLEFASLYANMGSEVTVFDATPSILGRYEPVVADLAKSYLEEDGVSFQLSSHIEKVSSIDNQVVVRADNTDYQFDAVLYATGRKPATEGLGLENTGIVLTDRGAIQVDDYLETSVKGVYAVGDVHGGLQFTYTSLDDFRIVFGRLTGTSDYNLSHRQNVPNTVFIEPPLSQVGLTEAEVKSQNIPYKTKELKVATMPRAHVDNNLRGIYKVIVNDETKEILGATLFAKDSHEIINQIKMAMDNHIPYTYLKNQIFTHPTMSENLNDVFNL